MLFMKNGRLVQDGVDSLIPFISHQPIDMVPVDLISLLIRELDDEASDEFRSFFFAQDIKALPYNLVSSLEWLKSNEQIPDEITSDVQKSVQALKDIGATFRINVTFPSLESAAKGVFLNFAEVSKTYREAYGEEEYNNFTVGRYFADNINQLVSRTFVTKRIKESDFLETSLIEPSDLKEGDVTEITDKMKVGRYFAVLNPFFNGLKNTVEDRGQYIHRKKSIVVFLDSDNNAIDVRLCDCSTPVRLPESYRRKCGVFVYEPIVDGKPFYGEYMNVFAVRLETKKDFPSSHDDILKDFFCDSIVNRYKKIEGEFADELKGEVAHKVKEHIVMRKRKEIELTKWNKSRTKLGTILKKIGDKFYENAGDRKSLFEREVG